MMDASNSNPTNASATDEEAIAEAERLQGERFLQLSQRCHEQNWSQVHGLAEQIVLHNQRPHVVVSSSNGDKNTTTTTTDGSAGNNGGDGSTIDGNNKKPSNGGSASNNTPSQGQADGSVNTNNNKVPGAPPGRASRQGSVSISGEIMNMDEDELNDSGEQEVMVVSNGDNNISNRENTERAASAPGSSSSSNNNRRETTQTFPTTVKSPPPPPLRTPRMLSTCLGTASPLAWTCRYSAPSCTVKLVLGLDAAAVRRCLPQLGTPLHECVGRPRPLRKMPLKRGRWSNLIAEGKNNNQGSTTSSNNAGSSSGGAGAASSKSRKNKNKSSSSKKKKHKKQRTPRILAGLREWRRTVRTLIQADETLMKEDAKLAAALKAKEAAEAEQANNNNENENNSEEWRRGVQSMIKENVDNIQRFKNAVDGDGNATTTNSEERVGISSNNLGRAMNNQSSQAKPWKSSLKQSSMSNNQTQGPTVRATLAQDADGNTPLHFMIRGAASPAFGGGRWQARHEVEEDEYDDDSSSEEETTEGGNNTAEGTTNTEGGAMDVDSSAGEDAPSNADGNNNAATTQRNSGRDLRHIEYWGTSGSSWDGVRWCMEAHLRRVDHRMTRRKLQWNKKQQQQQQEEEDERNLIVAKKMSIDEDGSDGERGVARRAFASVRISSPLYTADEEVLDVATDEDSSKSPAKRTRHVKRKSVDLGSLSSEHSVKSIRRGQPGTSLLTGSASESPPPPLPPSIKTKPKGAGAGIGGVVVKKGKPSRRRQKYLDSDECQDCCYDPLLGAVRDLVHSCPEAAGIPDHREYEETPLIVALKSSIYVVMEPENDFQLMDRMPGAGGADGGGILPQPLGGGRAAGDGFAIFGGGILNGGAGGGGFPFPELGALMMQNNRPFNIFPDDEAMMAVLRGHGRRVTRNDRRRSAGNNMRRSAAANATPPPSGGITGLEKVKEDNKKTEGMDNDDADDDSSGCSSVSDSSSFDGDEDPRSDAFFPSASVGPSSQFRPEPPGVQLGLLPRRRPRYDYQTALEYRIFGLVRIMLDAYPRAACLMISDYTPLHSAVFHGRCPDTIRLLLDAEARFRSSDDGAAANNDDQNNTVDNGNQGENSMGSSSPLPLRRGSSNNFLPEPCPTLSGPAMLCTNTRGELPLHFACMRNECARSIRLLAEADPRAALVRDASGRTPLRWLWIRFVDGLLDRFGGRDIQQERDEDRGRVGAAGIVDHQRLAFQEQEGGNTGNFPNPGQSILGGRLSQSQGSREGSSSSVSDALSNSGRHWSTDENPEEVNSSPESMFVFDTEYLRRTRNIDRTVDFLRMRHVPSGFENIEYVAAEHAITVLLKLRYLQQRRNRQLEAHSSAVAAASGTSFGGAASSIGSIGSNSSGSSGNRLWLPPDVPMSTKEEFILYAFEKFTALIYAALVASEAEESEVHGQSDNDEAGSADDISDSSTVRELPSRKKLWHSLHPRTVPTSASNGEISSEDKKFYLVHEACGASRASCPSAVAKICIKLFSDQLFQRDDQGRLPLHRVACRGLGWEPPGSDIDANGHASLADETLTLLKEVLSDSHDNAPGVYDYNRQLPLHCAVDSLVTSLVMGKRRRASLHAEARVALQKYRHSHVNIAMECLSELLQANSYALQRRDGQSGLFPFMQAALPHVNDCAVVKYTSDLSRRPGFDVGVGFHSMERDVVEEDNAEAEADHATIIFFLLREDPSVISGLG